MLLYIYGKYTHQIMQIIGGGGVVEIECLDGLDVEYIEKRGSATHKKE